MAESADEDWFAGNSNDPGPSLEDFLATDPSQLPFLQERAATAEDFVRYQIFVDEWSSIEHLQQLRESVLELVDSITAGFIWHREAFALSVAVPSGGNLEPHLTGEQVFGGNVSDEWFVCYLLFTITSTFSELTACITDNDGEFLLIEAATAIPPFLSPGNSNHRVWVRSGEVHLVMPGCMVDRARTPRTLGSGSITLSEGLKAVRESDGGTKADEGVQQLIRRRIEGYPEEAMANMHHARCFLPLAAALAFRDTPRLVAPAVSAFCSGDPADRKMGVRMARLLALPASASEVRAAGSKGAGSQPEAPRFVEARIAFTRHLYAQLHQAAVVPTKAFPPGWGPSRSTLAPAAHAKAAQLGQKLSMGLEAAYQACAESSKNDGGDLSGAIRPESWKRFADGLVRNGFFEGELEGSKRFREKTAMAEQFIRDNVLCVDADGGEDEEIAAAQRDRRRCPVHQVVDRTLNDPTLDCVFDAFGEEDDKEDWMEVSQADLDIMLQDYRRAEADLDPEQEGRGDRGVNGVVGDDDNERDRSENVATSGAHETATDEEKNVQDGHAGFADAVDGLDDIVTGMNAFVDDSKAGLDGAEVEAVGGHVQFDVDKFMSLLNGEDLMSALEDAAKEDAHDELADSDDDLLESSEEEDEDEVDTPQRMPDPKASESAGLTDPSACGSRTQSSLAVNVSPNTPAKSSGLVDDSHVQTRSGVRPSVAFQMQEMEGRPSEEDGLGSDVRDQDGGRESKASSGSAENLVREYMAAMEIELEPSSMGESFEKVGASIPEAQMEELQTVGPLDQNGELAPEQWFRDGKTPSSTGVQS
ncbi:unnamed protein product [Ectocarpus sp. 4 AP-2014]